MKGELVMWKKEFERWQKFDALDLEMRSQLNEMLKDEKLLEDAFYKNLEFGTGGMRGEIGPGTNRMNIYTVRKASEGLARYIEEHGNIAKSRGVVIAYDSRHKSPEFAMEAAKILATHGIQTYVFSELRPTPELSFAVRYLHAFSGIVITASHNPPEYNGYKVYGEDGAQLSPSKAKDVINKVNEVENELALKVSSEEELKASGLISMIGENIDRVYLENLKKIRLNEKIDSDIRIVFSPLHGSGNKPVQAGLKAFGFDHVFIVKEQEQPDAQFSTVSSPNPEEKAAFQLAIDYGVKYNADILIATDPDADRLGIAVKNQKDEYILLTGNETGAILLHYILSQKKLKGTLPENGIVFKTIVTSELGRKIAESFQIPTEDVLTGFKFIGEKIAEYEETNKFSFLFGYEESYGYLIGDFARDKDAVQAAILACEACAYYKQSGKTLYDVLQEIYKQFGFFKEGLQSLTLKGKEGSEQINGILETFRKAPLAEVAGVKVVAVEDYYHQLRTDLITGETFGLKLPSSNVLKYFFEDGSWICLRPSGTEPKIKFYFSVHSDSLQESERKLERLKEKFMDNIYQMV